MPAKTPASDLKPSSPSKVIQQGIDNNWGGQAQNNTSAQQAIADQHNKKPVTSPGNVTGGDGK